MWLPGPPNQLMKPMFRDHVAKAENRFAHMLTTFLTPHPVQLVYTAWRAVSEFAVKHGQILPPDQEVKTKIINMSNEYMFCPSYLLQGKINDYSHFRVFLPPTVSLRW